MNGFKLILILLFLFNINTLVLSKKKKFKHNNKKKNKQLENEINENNSECNALYCEWDTLINTFGEIVNENKNNLIITTKNEYCNTKSDEENTCVNPECNTVYEVDTYETLCVNLDIDLNVFDNECFSSDECINDKSCVITCYGHRCVESCDNGVIGNMNAVEEEKVEKETRNQKPSDGLDDEEQEEKDEEEEDIEPEDDTDEEEIVEDDKKQQPPDDDLDDKEEEEVQKEDLDDLDDTDEEIEKEDDSDLDDLDDTDEEVQEEDKKQQPPDDDLDDKEENDENEKEENEEENAKVKKKYKKKRQHLNGRSVLYIGCIVSFLIIVWLVVTVIYYRNKISNRFDIESLDSSEREPIMRKYYNHYNRYDRDTYVI